MCFKIARGISGRGPLSEQPGRLAPVSKPLCLLWSCRSPHWFNREAGEAIPSLKVIARTFTSDSWLFQFEFSNRDQSPWSLRYLVAARLGSRKTDYGPCFARLRPVRSIRPVLHRFWLNWLGCQYGKFHSATSPLRCEKSYLSIKVQPICI